MTIAGNIPNRKGRKCAAFLPKGVKVNFRLSEIEHENFMREVLLLREKSLLSLRPSINVSSIITKLVRSWTKKQAKHRQAAAKSSQNPSKGTPQRRQKKQIGKPN